MKDEQGRVEHSRLKEQSKEKYRINSDVKVKNK